MKVIFLKDVPSVARAGEIKEVAPGYGHNYLIPRKLALIATQSAMKAAEAQIQREKEKQKRFAAEMELFAQQLEGYELNFAAKVAEEDRLYGSIRDSDIASQLSQATGVEIERKQVDLEEPIKTLGEHEVTIRLGKDLTPRIKVVVAKEE